uniref:Uncharacterized protein n=1 Tax=Arundo donax TaxID=35708 RepID=A0A0A9HQN9_ARUDO
MSCGAVSTGDAIRRLPWGDVQLELVACY